MAVIESMGFTNLHGDFKQIQLLHPERARTRSFETTVITGQNGSHKSSFLKQIAAMLGPGARKVDLLDTDKTSVDLSGSPLLCISGSLADRFPQKELPGGARTEYDVPNYTYIGQRVLHNLLSKKAPLEVMLSFALAPEKAERFGWKFFQQAHAHAGVEPVVEYQLSSTLRSKQSVPDLRGALVALTPDTDTDRMAARNVLHVSYAMAQWLLGEFTRDDFDKLQDFIALKRRTDVQLSADGVHCSHSEPNVLRLGLLLDVLRLGTVNVQSSRTREKFSAFELSSGEYHMFLIMLALGFGVGKETVVLIDEPENSLHPQWQRDLMTSVFEVFSEVMSKGHLIISTHSPLIVGAAPEGTSVVDLTGDDPTTTIVSYGASSDELLLTQFGVGSSRNKVVVDTIQRAVFLIERGNFSNPDFLALAPDLRLIREALTRGDPMVDVINALLDEGVKQ
ncbi:ATP-binding protein [Alcaligenes aquatilis]|uniref:ATP-binding protein n=1 Tax=Alcaligenes aquatilis TaxID=323284 RepID=UPI003D1A2A74